MGYSMQLLVIAGDLSMKALLDYIPLIIFFYYYKTTDPNDNQHPLLQLIGSHGNADKNNILVATCALLIATVIVYGCQFVFQKFRLDKMQWFVVISTLLFGGITLALSDDFYIKLKAVIINLGIGLGFLATPFFTANRQPIIRNVLDNALQMTDRQWLRLNWAWSGQFFILALLHVFFAFLYMDGRYWGEFTAFGDIIFSLCYLALLMFGVRKFFKPAK